MTPVQRTALVWLAAATTVGATMSLGFWQLRRADEKSAAQALSQQRQHLAPWRNADWPCGSVEAALPVASASAVDVALPVQRPVILTGQWLPDKTVFLDNRPMDTASGFIVVTPLRLSATTPGCGGGRVVLVQRGWVPRDARERLRLPEVRTPGEEVRVQGRVLGELSRAYQLGLEAQPEPYVKGPLVRQNVGAAFWSAWLGQSPLAGAVLQLQAAEPLDAINLSRHWPQPGSGREKNLAYAAQWFAMSALAIGLTIWFQIIRPRRFR